MTRHLSAPEVATRAGITYRKLDNWCVRGILRPIGSARPGSGGQRLFSRGEVRVVAFVARLAELRAPLATIAIAAAHARALPDEAWAGDIAVSRSGRIVPRFLSGGCGEACWLVNLHLCAQRAAA